MDIEQKKIIKKLKEFFTSMRFVILCLMMLLAILPVVSFDIFFLSAYKNGIIQQKTDEVNQEVEKISLKLSSYIKKKKYTMDVSNYNENGEVLKSISSYFDNIYVINTKFIIIDDISNYSKGMLMVSDQVNKALQGMTDFNISTEKRIISVSTPVVGEDGKNIVGAIFVTYPIDSTLRGINIVQNAARTLEFLIIVISIIIAYICAIMLTRPLKKMIKGISDVSDGHIKEIKIKTFDETRQISDAFNVLIKKQIKEDQIKQEFVSNVSHELKTPITSIKVLADSLLQQEDLSVEIYREFLQDICSEIDRESRIISDLLSLSRLEDKKDRLQTEKTSINDVILGITKSLEPLAWKKNVRILFDEFQDVEAWVDKIRMGLVFTNLIENAIKYNIENGWIRISLKADFNYFYFKVVDSGIGIKPDDQQYIFERFYRVDKARTSTTGGTGLGLSIVKSIVAKHNGLIRVESDGECGSTFIVRIPLEN